MRWPLRLGFLCLALWAIFMASPFYALYRLGRAVEAQDGAAIEARVDFGALRHHLTRQVVAEYLRSIGRAAELNGFSGSAAAGAGASIAEPLVARFVTPEALAHLMRGTLPAQDGEAALPAGGRLDLADLRQAWRVVLQSESRGFTNVFVPVPPERAAAEQYRLHLRLKGFTWRLKGVELPAGVVRDLAARLPRPSA